MSAACGAGPLAVPNPSSAGAARGLPVIEIFGPTLQGEGRSIGLKTMFVRLAGCDWACSWCDTPYAWRAGSLWPVRRMTDAEIVEALVHLSPACRLVSLSGGNPAIHDCASLVARLHAREYHVHVETQGTFHPSWLAEADSVTVSPKPPSSGMPTVWDDLAATLDVAASPELKVVVFDDADYGFAAEVRRRHPDIPFTLQLGNRVGQDNAASLLERQRLLTERVLADHGWGDVRVLPQLHVLLWGNRRGV